MKQIKQSYESRIAELSVDQKAQLNELEFRLEHQESAHQNELSDLEARLKKEFAASQRANAHQVSTEEGRKEGGSVSQSDTKHLPLWYDKLRQQAN